MTCRRRSDVPISDLRDVPAQTFYFVGGRQVLRRSRSPPPFIRAMPWVLKQREAEREADKRGERGRTRQLPSRKAVDRGGTKLQMAHTALRRTRMKLGGPPMPRQKDF
jgi:hypothetical protein